MTNMHAQVYEYLHGDNLFSSFFHKNLTELFWHTVSRVIKYQPSARKPGTGMRHYKKITLSRGTNRVFLLDLNLRYNIYVINQSRSKTATIY